MSPPSPPSPISTLPVPVTSSTTEPKPVSQIPTSVVQHSAISPASAQTPPSTSNPSDLAKTPLDILPTVLDILAFVEDKTQWTNASFAHAKLFARLSFLKTQQDDLSQFPTVIPTRSESSMKALSPWLREHGVCAGDGSVEFPFDFSLRETDNDAHMFARIRLEKGATFVRVPSAAMLRARPEEAPLQEMLEKTPAMRKMATLLLTVRLLVECASPASKWATYLGALPGAQGITPVFAWPPHLVETLVGSSAHGRLIGSLRSQVRDYCHVYKATCNQDWGWGRGLSWLNFSWAVSMIMTRGNMVAGEICLVPAWDMCNHKNGAVMTRVVEEDGVPWVEGVCMGDVEEGDPINICYGLRGNVELMLYSGFVEAENTSDRVRVWLEVGGDKLGAVKARLLGTWGRKVRELEGVWEVGEWVDWRSKCTERLLGVARVIAAPKEMLASIMRSGEVPKEMVGGADEEAVKGVVLDGLRTILEGFSEVVGDGMEIDMVRTLHAEEARLVANIMDRIEEGV